MTTAHSQLLQYQERYKKQVQRQHFLICNLMCVWCVCMHTMQIEGKEHAIYQNDIVLNSTIYEMSRSPRITQTCT